MPYITYSGRVVTNPQALSVEAAPKAEQRISEAIIRATNAFPATSSSAFNNANFKTKFKEYYRQELNRLLRRQYSYSTSAWPGTVLYDDRSFTLTDPTQYRLLKYWGLDC